MASSFSTDLKLELMVTGENAGTWGDKTNTNLNLIQQAIAGYQEISIAGGPQTTTLVMTDGAISNARNAVIKLTGAITGNQIVTVPSGIEKTYTVFNGTTGAFTVEFKTASGTGPTFSTTDKGIKIVYADGTNVVDILTGPLSAVTIGGNLSVDGGTIKLDGNYPVGTDNVALGDGALDDGSLTGGCNIAIGTSALTVNTTGFNSVAIGANALFSNTTGSSNVAIGHLALSCNTTGLNNTSVGSASLLNNTTGERNVAMGQGALNGNTTGNCNIAIGRSALLVNTTASNNTAIGNLAMVCNTTGCQNTAVGSLALDANTEGNFNTALGINSLGANTTGIVNTAVGTDSLRFNTTGCQNIAVGSQSLNCNTTGADNVAVGYLSLFGNTTASNNTAVGRDSLRCNTTGACNTAVGSGSLDANTTGNNNTALGLNALGANTTGANNVAIGLSALESNTTCNANTAIGNCTLMCTNSSNNVAIGFRALRVSTCGNNIAIGKDAGTATTTGIENLFIGNETNLSGLATGGSNTTGCCNVAVGFNSLRLNTTGNNNVVLGQISGDDAVASITTGSNNIVIGNNAHTCARIKIAFTVTSDARDKTCIDVVPHGLCFVKQLNPISFFYKKSREKNFPTGRKRYGFKAQDILPLEQGDAVIISDDEPENLKYNESSLIPVLVNAIKELTAKLEALENK